MEKNKIIFVLTTITFLFSLPCYGILMQDDIFFKQPLDGGREPLPDATPQSDGNVDSGYRCVIYFPAIAKGWPPTLETLKNLLADLIEVDFLDLDDNPEHQGFYNYWKRRADSEGLEVVVRLLQTMVNIKPEVEGVIEAVHGREINFLDDDYGDDGFITFWAENIGTVDEYGIEWTMGYTKNVLTNMAEIAEEASSVIEIDLFDDDYGDSGFLTFWAQQIVSGEREVGEVEQILVNMGQILDNDYDGNTTPEIVELIGEIDLFDDNYDDNGFLTYWAERAIDDGIDYVNRHLYIWKRISPTIDYYVIEGPIDFYNPQHTGVVSYWAGQVEKKVDEEGMYLEAAIYEILAQIISENQSGTSKIRIDEIETSVEDFKEKFEYWTLKYESMGNITQEIEKFIEDFNKSIYN